MNVTAPAASLGHDPVELRELADQLLSRPPYQPEDESRLLEVLRRVGRVVGDALGELFGGIAGTPAVAWLIALVGLAALGAVVWRATRGLTGGVGATLVPSGVSTRSAADHHAEADAHRAAGRLREALRCRYVALVATLVEAGVLDDVPGRTVRELDAEVEAAVPTLAAVVRAAGERLEAAVYGDAEVSAEDLGVVDRAAREVADARPVRTPVGAS